MSADVIRLETNYKDWDNDWIEANFKEFDTLINISFLDKTSQKNLIVEKADNLKVKLVDDCQLTFLKQNEI